MVSSAEAASVLGQATNAQTAGLNEADIVLSNNHSNASNPGEVFKNDNKI